MSKRHDQELKARMRAVDALEQEKARLLDSRDRDQAELTRLRESMGHLFTPDSGAAIAMQPIKKRATATNARLYVIDAELTEHRPRIEQLNRWLFAEKLHGEKVADVSTNIDKAQSCVQAIEDLTAKRAALAKQRDGEAAEARQADAAATSRLAAAVLQRIGVKMRDVPQDDAKPSAASAARISSIAALDVALDEIDGQLAQLHTELDAANRAADTANREAVEQGAYMAELAFDDALHVFVQSYADYRVIFKQAFDILPESPAIDRLADEVEAARKPVDDDGAPVRKRGVFGFFKGATA